MTRDDAGARVDVVVARYFGVTRGAAQRALKAGEVTLDGKEASPSRRVAVSEIIEGVIEVTSDAPPAPEHRDLTVRYSDERVLVVSKPPGLVTHPGPGNPSGTLVNALLGLGGSLALAEGPRPGIVHRLDKDTSGLLLVARDDDAHGFLSAALKRREVGRTYLALVRGTMPAATGTIEAPLGRHPRNRRKFAVVPEGRVAVTHYRVLASEGALSLLEVTLETGRTHQIRVHLAHLGHPVVGDSTYGGRSETSDALGLDRPFLHAHRLEFPHPDGGQRTVTDPLPDDLVAAADAAGLELPEDA